MRFIQSLDDAGEETMPDAIRDDTRDIRDKQDAIRQIFLGSGPAQAGLGVTVMGHTMTLAEDVAIVGIVGVALLIAAAWAFGRQE